MLRVARQTSVGKAEASELFAAAEFDVTPHHTHITSAGAVRGAHEWDSSNYSAISFHAAAMAWAGGRVKCSAATPEKCDPLWLMHSFQQAGPLKSVFFQTRARASHFRNNSLQSELV
jgi:hypothetical protein